MGDASVLRRPRALRFDRHERHQLLHGIHVPISVELRRQPEVRLEARDQIDEVRAVETERAAEARLGAEGGAID